MFILRLCRILLVAAKHRLDLLLPSHYSLPFWARGTLALFRLLPKPGVSGGICLRLALEELGPVFIKFGQVLSTRRDLFPDEIADELQKLQDQVPPFPTDQAREIIETALEGDISALFAEFDDQPLASASVAQVYAASLADGSEVIVKVIRPDVEKTIRKDLRVMFLVARLAERLWEDGRRLHPADIVKDYEHTILDELDLQLEAANTSQLRKNWEDSDELYIPMIHWNLTRRNVIVMERIHGIGVADVNVLREHKVDLEKLANLGVKIFFTQVFEHNFFHADMHPGNVLIARDRPDDPQYIALDCAIIGSLSEEDKAYLAKNLLAFFNRDYQQVARLHIESGWVPQDTDLHQFETVIRSVCEPVFQKPIKEISFARVLVNLFQTARKFNMEIQPQLVLLQKTLINIEGLGRQLHPDLDLWTTAKPFMEKWVSERFGPAAMLKQLGEKAPQWLEQLPQIPQLAYDAMQELKQLGSYNQRQMEIVAELRNAIELERKRSRFTRLGGLVLIASLLLAWFPDMAGESNQPIPLGSWILGSVGIYWLFIKP
ncbi:MAG: ubiquinone biosynthesis regulatory protein kinase UbiB [Pseudomonadales bacterium]|nr:ubiquinone biosynthesis regulatory protein kinase UbiB [Pseudomonadales bacterium]MDP7144423.1 ubiquinone biosynthesis regulatory protein kinase UbiB [Pseudomonadales bacterium]MDP7358025.1 ubiquinone biosynthesis regulatory protein kinase UbiB [Pseudomonadales bacterium]MDP7597494.1 ubiquinone biosynthesis regulatory protein kinase UbiB [Pseudomonadales bacterium]HJN52532.1 ubiquinone biosynthesis regulatory protein kinase UbiB [Pseudomonadales bacterium]